MGTMIGGRRARRSNDLLLLLLLALAATMSLAGTMSGEPGWVASSFTYFLVMFFPGAALYLLSSDRMEVSALLTHSFVASPALSGALGAAAMALGARAEGALAVTVMASASLAAAAYWRRRFRHPPRAPGEEMGRGEWIVLALMFLLFAGASCYLPLSSSFWRLRSDGWFHAAVVAEVENFGVPPGDPYFAGLKLQYMWVYHVLILILAKGTAVSAEMAMPLVNAHALAGLLLAAYTLSRRLGGSARCAAFSAATVVLSLNAAFWVFLPLKMARAFFGEVRGWAEVARILSLSDLDLHKVRSFLNIYFNESYFLDKFTVSTAFSLALAFMGGFWRGAVLFVEEGRAEHILLALASLLGMLLFHPVVGVEMLAALGGGLVLLHALFRAQRYRKARALYLLAGSLLVLVAVVPYLRSVTSLKESSQLLPFGISFRKLAGLVISCSLAAFLASFQVGTIWRQGSPGTRFLLLATLCLAIYSLLMVLPGPNDYNKPPFFVNYPLAILGGWTLAQGFGGRLSGARVLVLAALLLLPENAIALYGYARTPRRAFLSPSEEALARWVGRHTPRDAVFIDSGDRVFLLVAGPRRYYWGTQTYARMWGYRRDLMEPRKRLRDELYREGELSASSLALLAHIPWETYVIGRGEEGLEGKVRRHPEIFQQVWKLQDLTLYRIDREACRIRQERG